MIHAHIGRTAAFAAAASLTLLLSACDTGRPNTPVSPSARAAATPALSPPAAAATTSPAPAGSSGHRAVLPVDLPGPIGSIVAFPPRNESFDFRQELERKYRDGLRRTAGSSFTDVEGDVVWTQEYLRYRTNGCGHADAVQRVLVQVAGGAGPPVCGDVPSGVVAFPPRNESFAFREELERTYRDALGRTPSSTFVDLEGAIVWTQEYLRYRVNDCPHASAVARVFLQIDGGPISPVCRTGGPQDRFSGVWHGTSDYPNAPFTMDLILRGDRVGGWYEDQKDRGSVAVVEESRDTVRFQVNFGDGGFFMDGRFEDENRIRGTFRVSYLGGRVFWFDMRR